MRRLYAILAALTLTLTLSAQRSGGPPAPGSPAAVAAALRPQQGDYVAHDFTFTDGEKMAALRLHYTTLGAPVTDKFGKVSNAVLVMHGTTGSGRGFLSANFAGVLFGPGELLDARKYYIILPDAIGTGQSSKPSDGLRAKFPHYGYVDIVHAQHELLLHGLKVNHLRLVMGTSMGGMQSWMWAEMYPDFMDAAMPLASLPVQIAGRNRYFRRMVIDSITTSPDYDNGNYTQQPHGLISAVYTYLVMTSSPKDMQKQMPTKALADAGFDAAVKSVAARMDANDMLYQFAASSDYNPEPDLEKIQCHLMAINSADDQVNPPEVGALTIAPLIRRVRHGEYVLLPISDATRGHGTHSLPAIWKDHLARLLQESERFQDPVE